MARLSIDVGLLILRVAVGLTLASHGSQKLFGWFGGPGLSGWTGATGKMGMRPAPLFALLAALGEFGGGLLLALGFLMPLPAVGTVATMAVAIIKAHWKNGFFNGKGGIEFPLTLLVASGVIGLVGPGAYSLDAAFGINLPTIPVFVGGLVLALIIIGIGMLTGQRPATTQNSRQPAA